MARNDIYNHYEAALQIDRNALDDALIYQPESYNKVAGEYVLAVSRRDQAKLQLKKTEAEAITAIREELETKGEKFTESKLSALVQLDAGVEKAAMDVVTLTQLAGHWGALKDSFEQRADVLKSLTHLYIAGYYSNATGSGERAGARENKSESVKELMAEKRKRVRLGEEQ